MRYIGIIFVITFVVANLLILVNIVIAMMADTYSNMTSFRKGLHNYNIVRLVPEYEVDRVYGVLHLTFPFSLIAFFMLPYYLFAKDKKSMKLCTRRIFVAIYMIAELPILSATFMVMNVTMLPFAYLKTCWHKL